MKAQLPMTAFACAAAVAFLCISIAPAQAQTQWSMAYDAAGSESANSVKQTADGGYIAVGQTDSVGGGDTDAVILRLAQDGTIAWQHTLGDGENDSFRDVVEAPDGSFVAIGEYGINSFRNTGWAVKFSAAGAVLWDFTYDIFLESWFRSMALLPNGQMVVCGWATVQLTPSPNIDAILVLLDSDGSVLESAQYDGGAFEYAQSVYFDAQGDVLIGGVFAQSSTTVEVLAMKLKRNGNPRWSKTYSFGPDAAPWPYSQMRPSEDGGMVLTGPLLDSVLQSRGGYVLKLNSGGAARWMTSFMKNQGSADAELACVLEARGGSVVAAGRWEDKLWMQELSPGGTPRASLFYSASVLPELALSIEATADNGLIVGGVGPNLSLWLHKTNRKGVARNCFLAQDAVVVEPQRPVTTSDLVVNIGRFTLAGTPRVSNAQLGPFAASSNCP